MSSRFEATRSQGFVVIAMLPIWLPLSEATSGAVNDGAGVLDGLVARHPGAFRPCVLESVRCEVLASRLEGFVDNNLLGEPGGYADLLSEGRGRPEEADRCCGLVGPGGEQGDMIERVGETGLASKGVERADRFGEVRTRLVDPSGVKGHQAE